MPETPDFEQLARAIVKAHDNADGEGMDGNPAFLPIDHEGQLTIAIVEQLRLVWNARGAADLATIETSLSSQMGSTAAGPYVKNLDRELRKLDR